MSVHLEQARLLALLALPEHDPERLQAYAHAAQCDTCRRALREHEQMLRVLDASFALPAIEPALAARIQARVRPRRWPRLVLLSTWLASLALLLATAHELGPVVAAIGWHCSVFEGVVAALPLGVAALLTRRGTLRLDATEFALVAATGGVVAQTLLIATCPVNGWGLHAFVFHFLVVLALSWMGAQVGRLVRA